MKGYIFYPLLGVALACAFIAGVLSKNPEKSDSSRTSSAGEASLIELVNQVRAKNGVAPLTEDPGLDNTAKIKGDDMAARNYWAHTDPDGVEFQVMIIKNRPGLQLYGENLAECFQSDREAVDGWIGSPGHFANMVDPRYSIIGSYTVWDQDKGCLIMVNHFGGLPR